MKRDVLVALALFIVSSTLLVGCGSKPPAGSIHSSLSPTPIGTSSSSSTSSSNSTAIAQQVVSKVITAISQAQSVKMDSDVLYRYDTYSKYGHSADITRWNESSSIDISNQEMQTSTVIDNADFWGNFYRFTINGYETEGYYYEQNWLTGAGNTGGVWNKYKVNGDIGNSEGLLPIVLDLLKSSTEAALLGSEQVGNIDCYVLNITPSAETVADWVMSQQKDVGPSLTISSGPSLTGKDTFAQSYKGGIFQLWIASDSYLPVKAIFSPHFEAHFQSSSPDVPLTPDPSDSGMTQDGVFWGLLSFSNYNQLVSVQLPPEAAHAIEH